MKQSKKDLLNSLNEIPYYLCNLEVIEALILYINDTEITKAIGKRTMEEEEYL